MRTETEIRDILSHLINKYNSMGERTSIIDKKQLEQQIDDLRWVLQED